MSIVYMTELSIACKALNEYLKLKGTDAFDPGVEWVCGRR